MYDKKFDQNFDRYALMVSDKNNYKLFIPSYYDSPLKKNSGEGAKFYSKKGSGNASTINSTDTQDPSLSALVDASDLLLQKRQPKKLVPFYDYYGQFLIITEKLMELFADRMKKDLEIVEVELRSASGKMISLKTRYFALRTTKVVDCINLEKSLAYSGDTFSECFAGQQRYDDLIVKGEKPDFTRPPNPYYLTSKKVVLKPGAISPDSVFFTPKHLDCPLIDKKFAKDLLKMVVSEGGEKNYTFWLLDLKNPFSDFLVKCNRLG